MSSWRARFFQRVRLLLDHNIDEFAGYEYLFYDLLAGNKGANFFLGKSAPENYFFGCVGGHNDVAAQLAVNLQRNFNFLLLRQGGIVFGPSGFQEAFLFARSE